MSIHGFRFFQQKLLAWHRYSNKRELPWKGEKDVYRIWLSEIILQQTRAEQGRKYYDRFVQTYPTVRDLANAPLDEVYKLWEGLGYYNRCKNLHNSARFIVEELNGEFPTDYDSILELKGVGPYTAAAIASFAYNLPYAVVDGNVFRVLSRFFGKDEPIDSVQGKRLFTELAQHCLSPQKSARYNQAIMDFGATVCKPDAPLCTKCVMRTNCVAFQKNKVHQLPVKEKQVKQRSRWFVYFIMQYKGRFAMEQRAGTDIWQHLYQFPMKELPNETAWKKQLASKTALSLPFEKETYQVLAVTKPVVQKLSHQIIHAHAVLVRLSSFPELYKGAEWKTKDQLQQVAIPRLLHLLLKNKVLELFDAGLE